MEGGTVRGQYQCPICLTDTVLPRALLCLHSFCEGCINKLKTEDKIICPLCRKESKIPNGDVFNLNKNFYITQAKTSLICSECSVHDAVFTEAKAYCQRCQILLCYQCSKIHLRRLPFANHQLLSLNNSICITHGKPLMYSCRVCRHDLCPHCVSLPQHAQHPRSIVEIEAEVRDMMKENVSLIQVAMSNLKSKKSQASKSLIILRNCCNSMAHEKERMKFIIDRQFSDLKEGVNYQIEKAENLRTHIDINISELHRLHGELVTTSIRNRPITFYSLSNLQEALQKQLQISEGLCKEDVKTTKFVPNAAHLKLEQNVGRLETSSADESSRSSDRHSLDSGIGDTSRLSLVSEDKGTSRTRSLVGERAHFQHLKPSGWSLSKTSSILSARTFDSQVTDHLNHLDQEIVSKASESFNFQNDSKPLCADISSTYHGSLGRDSSMENTVNYASNRNDIPNIKLPTQTASWPSRGKISGEIFV